MFTEETYYSKKMCKFTFRVFPLCGVSSTELPNDDVIKEHLKVHATFQSITTFFKSM